MHSKPIASTKNPLLFILLEVCILYHFLSICIYLFIYLFVLFVLFVCLFVCLLDNGVGKGFTVKTIAEAIYQYGDPISSEYRGLLYIHGSQYAVCFSPLLIFFF